VALDSLPDDILPLHALDERAVAPPCGHIYRHPRGAATCCGAPALPGGREPLCAFHSAHLPEGIARIVGEAVGAGDDLREANLAGAGLARTDLRGARLDYADLTDADLSGAQLEGASLRGADFTRANLSGARLREADLTGARLSFARMTGADLSGAALFQADLEGARMSEVVAPGGYLAEAEMQEARLVRSDLASADLSRADLTGARLTGARLARAQLYAARMSAAELYGADISLADLGSADLAGADLSAANLKGADLRGADLSGAKLVRADMRGADLRYATIGVLWVFRGRTDAQREAVGTMRPADLRNADLRGAELRGVAIAPETRVEGLLLGRCPLCEAEDAAFDELLADRALQGARVSHGACNAVYRQLAQACLSGGLKDRARSFWLSQARCLRRQHDETGLSALQRLRWLLSDALAVLARRIA